MLKSYYNRIITVRFNPQQTRDQVVTDNYEACMKLSAKR